ncbi:cytochrome P450 [Mytilinidion resinicola]|uniref:Cytochrome P450 n=1 Tax=Mytilinidion resinicola TaxID=574789 RepID=A0A6A6YLE5_9PEZI|nr:cytochrome P450 [Mytilinidion resinicola]KAF2809358.1 cytochrome P450 [Mytilinidion resinicola]
MSVYFATLGISIAFYRLFLNPLRRFPGDTLPALTKWQSFWVAKYGQTHHFLFAQHQKYGDYVRVGPNELSVTNVDDLPIIHGNRSKFNKGPWYWKNLNEPEPGLFSVQDWDEHKARRKAWDTAFGVKSLKAYEPRIATALDHLCARLDQFAKTGEYFDMSLWAELLAFDVMGDLGFGDSFHMLESGELHHYVEFVHIGLKFMCTLAPISWAMPLLSFVPVDKKTREVTARFFAYGADRFKSRLAKGPIKNDVFGFLLAAREEGGLTDAKLESDARNVLLGGGDTTAVLMTSLLFYLTRHPAAKAKLQAEVNTLFKDEPFDAAKLGGPPYLNACINEALRMIPPGPNGMQRVVNTPGGITLNGRYVPEGTKISVHGWSVMHDPRNFARPEEFIPERWIEGSGFKGAHNAAAFIPFSQGTYQCVGRRLALQESRMFLVRMFQNYDFQIDPNLDPKAYVAATESYLTITKSALPLTVTKLTKT